MREVIEQEIGWLREQVTALRRSKNGLERQIDHFETRIHDLLRIAHPPQARTIEDNQR